MTKPAFHRIRMAEGRTLTMPFDLLPGPGLTCVRLEPGGEADIESARWDQHSHFVNMAIRHGDFAELDASAPSNPDAPKPIALPRAAGGDLSIPTGMPTAKE